MKILAIDPASSSIGLAKFNGEEVVDCFTFSTKGNLLIDRMLVISKFIIKLLREDKYDYIAVETPYLGFNRSTAMKMGQIFGITSLSILLAGYKSDQIIQIHPMTAKKAAGLTTVVKREKGKKLVIEFMSKRFPNIDIVDDNMADALAIGLAAINIIKEKQE